MTASQSTDEFVTADVEQLDRRESDRVAIEAKVELESFAKFLGETVDLGVGGVFVETHEEFDVGARLDLSMWVPEAQEFLRLVGEIRWCDPEVGGADEHGYGIEFVGLSDDDVSRLERVVEKCRRTSNSDG